MSGPYRMLAKILPCLRTRDCVCARPKEEPHPHRRKISRAIPSLDHRTIQETIAEELSLGGLAAIARDVIGEPEHVHVRAVPRIDSNMVFAISMVFYGKTYRDLVEIDDSDRQHCMLAGLPGLVDRLHVHTREAVGRIAGKVRGEL